MKYTLLIFALLVTFFSIAVKAQNSDKHAYNIFFPTPKNLMRNFETDRPDATESAYTVDAGHLQFETDLFKTERTNFDGTKTTTNSFNSLNFKIGITNSLDIQFVTDFYVMERISGNDPLIVKTSFSNLTIRLKQNIWGNDHGETALAILPYINIPTVSDQKITGGIILPLGVSLPNEWGFGIQVESDIETNQSGSGFHLNFLVSSTVSHQLISGIDFFVEGLVNRESESDRFDCFLNGGFVYKLKENIKLDTGLNYGLKNSLAKVFFIGLSFRI